VVDGAKRLFTASGYHRTGVRFSVLRAPQDLSEDGVLTADINDRNADSRTSGIRNLAMFELAAFVLRDGT
jgi:hypothetical protein